ncbi:hypothetical protein CCACVL1_01045 [Corchorus capsularis]|uniref:Uncharacterized protein n=1 Tax=Corchorus capsularis TaxID=210143 RepID=A0A1R3KRP1_COCAP|nr:hypothetical protein CCACVL1_01045 [Corchorus capsularis]
MCTCGIFAVIEISNELLRGEDKVQGMVQPKFPKKIELGEGVRDKEEIMEMRSRDLLHYSILLAVKYLYKYIYKGHDRVAVYIANGQIDIDEIEQFQDVRWVSAQEAMWRIYEFNLNEIYPEVTKLQLYLPGQQTVTF